MSFTDAAWLDPSAARRCKPAGLCRPDVPVALSRPCLASDTAPPDPVLHWIAKQVRSDAEACNENGARVAIAVNQDCARCLPDRLLLLEQQLATVSRLALMNELPEANIPKTALRISPQDAMVPDEVQALSDLASDMLARIRTTELLVDSTHHITPSMASSPASCFTPIFARGSHRVEHAAQAGQLPAPAA